MELHADTRAMMKEAALERIDAILAGSVVMNDSQMIRIQLGDDEKFPVAWFTQGNLQNLALETAAKRLNSYKDNRIAKLDIISREDADAKIEKSNADKKERNVTTATANNETATADQTATKVEYPELPTIEQPFTDELASIKSGKYQLGDSRYAVQVKRNREKEETFIALLDGDKMTPKGRSHKVIAAVFPYHASKSRRGYDVDKSAAEITAKPNGEGTEKKADERKAPAAPARYDIVVLNGNDKVVKKLVKNDEAAKHGGGKGLEKIARAAVLEYGKKVETRNLKSGTVYTFKPRKAKA